MGPPVTTAALIVAAGRGTRAGRGPEDVPKQYALLAGCPVLAHTIAAFRASPLVSSITVVIHPDDAELYAAGAPKDEPRLTAPVTGGATRQDSVRLGLEALATAAPDFVLIHDAARPLLTPDVIARVHAALAAHDGAIAAEPLADTLKRDTGRGTIADTVPRAGLWRAQTPQGFRFAPILAAHQRAAAEGAPLAFTDDAAIAEWAGLGVALVAGSTQNLKITTAEDMAMAERLLRSAAPAYEPRIGTGFDVHAFCDGDHVWLAGVRIPHDRGLLGHSDADAPLHALTDALLGAIGDGDIGQHFPPSDPAWKGAPSRLFLEDAARRIAARGGRITNVDVTILCEEPRIGPHRDAMRAVIAEVLGIDVTRVAVKATTTERLGFTGRKEGIAALASATVLLPV
ncbi:bifunctional 2-C-methyl-D-erythritol 4-phosphate cytidylyltransferase/2-C-methyl-D-erythritol 2,4-cyclodiphosphate synthase [Hyphomicrobium sp. CS1GBMeth3]|uniref:bifunctional 2-C-methyl-D-erythritol 4-phosphate cytidylyltransferase/2-C-methyl-D-erythritol 2,4-cyclodiphosphate synthase n=1 Tax=Hyphomicrobium sp. CS1GBMeth3 TaxID=1892845 RepID=UPI00093033B7|nr:bifunctional 2-C-methyl-D-erythritol 4-phosphate cytidylyltransferase/2-C-methyl-D-erythritol 2,4-cyclodiphosphate synthase [Hyphomicrobium sp. CS1GBMeth3]